MSTETSTRQTVSAGIGTDAARPDGGLKARGEFAFSSDLWHDDMLWGVTLRSPHAHAAIAGIDIGPALTVPGVHAVLTHADVPGPNRYGLERDDQPVLADDVVRFQGEPVAVIAADHPETARRAAARIKVDYRPRTPVTDAMACVRGEAEPLHDGGNVVRYAKIRKGDAAVAERDADVVVFAEYQVGMQDQAFLGPESGLAIPAEDGGVDLHVATQWLHADQRQIANALGLPPGRVRLALAGVGGAFGGREDLSMQVHACMLALRTGKPVKMVYNREESFFGHVHRHPATLRYTHAARADGTLVSVRAEIYLDGGAYASSTEAVVGNAATLGIGPYAVDNVAVDCWGVYTNNPPCGAMRGFGAVQAAFAYESQMDALARRIGVDPVQIRVRNAIAEGDTMPTGQRVDSPAPVAELLRRLQQLPLPARDHNADLRSLPGGVANTTHGEGVVRGVGYGVGVKNVCFSEGFDDFSTARVQLQLVGGQPAATVYTAAVEVGQGLVTVQQQIVRTELGVEQVTVLPADTGIGSGGSTSASRQTYVTGGAVAKACAAVRDRLFELAARKWGRAATGMALTHGKILGADGEVLGELAEALGREMIRETVEFRHRATQPVHPDTGQGNAHVQYAFAAHRAVVDVDTELGLVKVVALDCAQDVGRAMNPQAVLGQIHGGSAQGLGLAVMEEIQVADGLVRNPSFTDYLIPTILDMPPMSVDVLEFEDPHAPYGLRGVGEPPTISSTPAIVAAIRAATGKTLLRVPVRPEHITGKEALWH